MFTVIGVLAIAVVLLLATAFVVIGAWICSAMGDNSGELMGFAILGCVVAACWYWFFNNIPISVVVG